MTAVMRDGPGDLRGDTEWPLFYIGGERVEAIHIDCAGAQLARVPLHAADLHRASAGVGEEIDAVFSMGRRVGSGDPIDLAPRVARRRMGSIFWLRFFRRKTAPKRTNTKLESVNWAERW